ncbi:hypothetical protein [Pseudomonas marincola]|uniref:hypothetical protein n=1 Tax=Pseudomonas marincola TaxID=437900 RepID=UPI00147E9DBB|nr:hypothetical protein [Pseudomonas marincola]
MRSTAIRQGDAIAQSTDQRKIPHRHKTKTNPRNTDHRHDANRDVDSILRNKPQTSLG